MSIAVVGWLNRDRLIGFVTARGLAVEGDETLPELQTAVRYLLGLDVEAAA